MLPNDAELVQSALQGEMDAYSLLVRRYSNALYSIAYSVTGDFHLAQDIAQDCFMKAYNRLHTLQDHGKFASWLYAIARRVSLDYARKQKSRPISLHDSRLSREASPDRLLERSEIKHGVWNSLRMLNEPSRRIVVLFYLCDWSIKEIASFLGLTEKAVESRLRRGRNVLKKELAGEFDHSLRSRRLGEAFQERVIRRLIRRMGCIYVPVTDRFRTIEWFVRHFGVSFSSDGNPMLPSGETLYFLESASVIERPRRGDEPPITAFSVENPAHLHQMLRSEGVDIGELEAAEGYIRFTVYDPDKNAYVLCEKNSSVG